MGALRVQKEITVTTEEVGILYPVVKVDVLLIKVRFNELMARGSFDRMGSRVEVLLTKSENYYDTGNNHYIISVPNFYFSMETSNPRNVVDKITGHDISTIDAETIQMAVRKMMILMQDYISESV